MSLTSTGASSAKALRHATKPQSPHTTTACTVVKQWDTALQDTARLTPATETPLGPPPWPRSGGWTPTSTPLEVGVHACLPLDCG